MKVIIETKVLKMKTNTQRFWTCEAFRSMLASMENTQIVNFIHNTLSNFYIFYLNIRKLLVKLGYIWEICFLILKTNIDLIVTV